MSGDVQPRKRKDKRKKKDELTVEEPRGTAAALGEGDIFIHSYSEHGTGGHWCAKVIFFSLLAILVTLIGLIILENRGLSELEANAVESRYSGVLEGWLEDTAGYDHHDEHTLELNHHQNGDELSETDGNDGLDNNEMEADSEGEQNPEDDGNDDDVNEEEEDDYRTNDVDDEENQENDDDEENQQENLSQEQEDEEEETQSFYSRYFGGLQSNPEDAEGNHEIKNESDDDNEFDNQNDRDRTYDQTEEEEEENDDMPEHSHYGSDNALETNDDDAYEDDTADNNYFSRNDMKDGEHDENNYYGYEEDGEYDESHHNNNNEDKDDDDEKDNEEHGTDDEIEQSDDDIEVEKIEKEDFDNEEPISTELPALPEEDSDDDDDNKHDGDDDDDDHESDDDKDDENDDKSEEEDDDFLDPDDDLPVIEHITAPPGKPFREVDEDDISNERPPDTLDLEEEYEKKQEELRREEEQASHMWLKLTVGAALLVATHAIIRRASGPRDDELRSREETPSLSDRRMTLIPESPLTPVVEESEEIIFESARQIRKIPLVIKSAPTPMEMSLEEEEPHEEETKPTIDKELYSDDEDIAEDEEEEEMIVPKKQEPTQQGPERDLRKREKTPERELTPDDDDVEIIDEEQLDEELEEEDDDISDFDDAELLSRLEAKYGRLPEPERPGQIHKDGGNSIEDLWPGEPSDPYWRQQLDQAERERNQGAWEAAIKLASQASLSTSGRARSILARSYDALAEAKRDNLLLTKAINAYLELLKMHNSLDDKKLLDATNRTIQRIYFRGIYLSAEPVYKLLIRRFPNEVKYRNNLTTTYLMAGRTDLAELILMETLQRWPDDSMALGLHALVLKTEHKKYDEAVKLFEKSVKGQVAPDDGARFHYHWGEALMLLNRFEEANDVHTRGALLGYFLSPSQRSPHIIKRLKSQPWWNINKTPYSELARNLENSWREILFEGEAAKKLYDEENEGLRTKGEWSQLNLFARGQEISGRCKRAPKTCSILRRQFSRHGLCHQGQIKFSLMGPGTHVRPHVGPTNCRLRIHLGLSNTKDTYIRVDKEIRQWQEGKVLMFDDSFEHEVWHNGSLPRMVLIVDVWHPDLTQREKQELPVI